MKQLLEIAKQAALEGGAAIIEVYEGADFGIETKGDQSPLTKADRLAHKKIVSHLEPTGIPILSEEGKAIPYEERKQWTQFWLVDPLDGTKEFIKRNGEFTVNIALIEHGKPVLGVVYTPVLGNLYWGIVGEGAFMADRKGNTKPLTCPSTDLTQTGIRVVASRSHLNDETQAFIDGLKEPQLVSMGSSLKFLMLAEGKADVYPRFAPTMEWDTGAAQAVVEAAGGEVLRHPENTPLEYNKENLLNPYFWVRGK
ncbi:3'(2'), 5'-bisphosphate nucleotidase [Catalinimonas alkaloidigena]|uniref:3'(2'),5'-bisphosphate nucleotidase CysQ n=1 Tax=Catalinimonas alkaloidigena TaxID=1075417 RepID=A0A1G9LFR1_9BACT|nr:3'(2'),5'-bisphosphate nucleotidase CysQ [Catalinimonas alkaloidigena]SDL60781.1 3'(2'), 5'-bisphosphate nucleotidase [Catalinimonas alkaloidigena]